ncbi:CCAAT-box-binding transcription factor [Giardia muris]|uniref:CCAAT-box-binding transcription factor n=1 Tax=Giardia muris TaxID=5742 RepID=A0A4Z1T4Y5_GIAMU|nr:CCAAT-box-binding transcription factor [Giardia muris]|eukprot:TNJ28147.1 CCAAT-box-binding transcription factor [Giardia muris]
MISFPDGRTLCTTPWYRWFEGERRTSIVVVPQGGEQEFFARNYEDVCAHYKRLQRKEQSERRDQRWMDGMMENGTFKDRVAILLMQVRENPLISLSALQKLFEMGKDKKRHSADTSPALLEAFDVCLPTTRSLIPLMDRYSILRQGKDKLLLPENRAIWAAWYFEDSLLQLVYNFHQWNAERLGMDVQEWPRKQSIDNLFSLIPYPVITELAINYLIYKLGDTNASISSYSLDRLRAVILLTHPSSPQASLGIRREDQDVREKFSNLDPQTRVKILFYCVSESIAAVKNPNLQPRQLKMVISLISNVLLPFIKGTTDSEVKLLSDITDLFFSLIGKHLQAHTPATTDKPLRGKVTDKKKKKKDKQKMETPTQDENPILRHLLKGLSYSLKLADLSAIPELNNHLLTLKRLFHSGTMKIANLVANILLSISEHIQANTSEKLSKEMTQEVVTTTVISFYELLNRFYTASGASNGCSAPLLTNLSRCMRLTVGGVSLCKHTQAAFWKRSLQVSLTTPTGSFACTAFVMLGRATRANFLKGSINKNVSDVVSLSMPFFGPSYLTSAYRRIEKPKKEVSNKPRKPEAQEPAMKIVCTPIDTLNGQVSIITRQTSPTIPNNKKSSSEENQRGREQAKTDQFWPYQPETTNPAASYAANDELWELTLLQYHYHTGVRSAIKMMCNGAFPDYVQSEASEADGTNISYEFGSKAMLDFIMGSVEYCVGNKRCDLARVPPHLCLNGVMYSALDMLNIAKKKPARTMNSTTEDHNMTADEFLKAREAGTCQLSVKEQKKIIKNMTPEELDAFIIQDMKKEGLLDADYKFSEEDSEDLEDQSFNEETTQPPMRMRLQERPMGGSAFVDADDYFGEEEGEEVSDDDGILSDDVIASDSDPDSGGHHGETEFVTRAIPKRQGGALFDKMRAITQNSRRR